MTHLSPYPAWPTQIYGHECGNITTHIKNSLSKSSMTWANLPLVSSAFLGVRIEVIEVLHLNFKTGIGIFYHIRNRHILA